MFKVPDWEDDTSKVNLNFPKKAKTNKKKSKKILEASKTKGIIKTKLKEKNILNNKLVNKKHKKLKNNSPNLYKNSITNGDNKVIPNKIKKHGLKRVHIENKQEIKSAGNDSIESVDKNKKDHRFYDTDKLDELILDEKKQKLNSYKKDDIEEILFNENEISKLENIERTNKHKETKKLNQLPNRQKLEDKKNISLKSIIQKRNIKTSDKENTKKLDVQILKTKEERRNKIKKPVILQNGNDHELESKNLIIETKDEKKIKIQKSIIQNANKKNYENKTNKKINSLSNGNKVIKIKDEKKKKALKTILQSESYRNSINVSGNKLRERMLERLKAAQFRYLNEKLYTSSGSDAKQLFQEDPEAFQTYHEGYQQQVKRWPVKPLDIIVKRIQKMPKTHSVADMGCGEAELSAGVIQPVRSFDLVASKPGVETCDMAHTPLLSSSMDVAVYCLALMGTDLTQYLIEANRILKVGGHLLIAEVESRFQDVESFTRDVQKLGFSLKKLDKSQKVFFFMEFRKVRDPPVKKAKLPLLSLKPCIYKKR